MSEGSAHAWAYEEFGGTALGDARRVRRLVEMAAGAARKPSGRVSSVFERRQSREGAYDFLESQHVSGEAIAEQMYRSTASRTGGEPFVYVAIDGSSLTLSDEHESKGFGPVGTRRIPARGLMVTNALVVRRDGTPLGLIDQIFWSRDETLSLTRQQVVERNSERTFGEKEPANFVRSADSAIVRLREKGVRTWVVIDREGDNRDILSALAKADCLFTVRANYDRYLSPAGRLREQLEAEKPLGSYTVDVGRTGRRPARTVTLELRAKPVELLFRSRPGKQTETLKLTAVLVTERDGGKDALSWTLYTNAPVHSQDDGMMIVQAYRTRWRVEEFHRTWKRGECNVEDSQLRSADAVMKWATIMAAVATRIERLKYSSRHKPDEPATLVLTTTEIEVLLHDQHERARKGTRFKSKPIETVTMAEATQWTALMGGWIETNGPPGSITLARGLERLGLLAQGVELARRLNTR